MLAGITTWGNAYAPLEKDEEAQRAYRRARRLGYVEGAPTLDDLRQD